MCTTKRTYEFKKENEKTVKEDVVADVKDNYVQYHLFDDDSEIWVINDFNRVSTPKPRKQHNSLLLIIILSAHYFSRIIHILIS